MDQPFDERHHTGFEQPYRHQVPPVPDQRWSGRRYPGDAEEPRYGERLVTAYGPDFDGEDADAPQPRRGVHDELYAADQSIGYEDEPDVTVEIDHPRQASTRLRTKKSRQRRRLALVVRTSAAIAAIAIFLGAGFTWGTKQWADGKFRQVAALNLNSSAIVDAAAQRGDENFLLVGSDSRAGAEIEGAAGGPRSDTVMIAHVPADRSRMVLVSFPRDLQVDRPACEQWDATTGKYTGRRDEGQAGVKINTAYQHGGPRCLTEVVQQVSGLAVNHFVGIEFAGFDAMVGAAGGVQVCVEKPIQDDVLGPIVDRPGEVELTGEQALDFVRAGHVAGDPGSDHGRIQRQQQFLAALVRQALSERMLHDPERLRGFVAAMAAGTVADNVDVDQLLQLGSSLHGLDASKVTFVTVPTTGVANANGNDELRPEEAKALFRALIDDAPLPGQERPAGTAPGTEPAATVPPDQIKLQVLNGTGEEGLASQVTRRLRAVGFDVVKVDNAPEPVQHTVVRYSAAREAQARTATAAVPGAALRLDPTMGGAVEVVIGADFQGSVVPVQPGQPLPAQPVAAPAPAAGPFAVRAVSAADTSCA